MSRIGKMPIPVPDKVEVKLNGLDVSVKGPLGQLDRTFKGVKIAMEDKVLQVSPLDGSRQSRAFWGLSRSLLNNMVVGVSEGFTKVLEIHGVGYRAEAKGKALNLNLGHSHQINYEPPASVTFSIDKQTVITLKSPDKEALGQAAAKIRSFRPPEPYKGKGVRYQGEHIRIKAGKAGAA